MFKPVDTIVEALRDLHSGLADLDPGGAIVLGEELDTELERKRPDLTESLISTARAARQHGVELDEDLTAACCRAGCARLGKVFPGASIEVRVPPVAAVQIGFGDGPRHTRGTPPNVVEMSPLTFIDLATGNLDWETSKGQIRSSGAHAHEIQQAFPLRKT